MSTISPAAKSEVERLLKLGRGQGIGSQYLSWIRTFDVPSDGEVTRWWSNKLHRRAETLSGGETKYGQVIDWSPTVLDFHEQKPLLPLEETLDIASDLRVDHPAYRGVEKVVTIDFHLLKLVNGLKMEVGRSYKPADLLDDRTLEKEEIARVYYERRGQDWGLVTAEDVPKVIADNARRFSTYARLDEVPGFTVPDLEPFAEDFISRLAKKSDAPISHLCSEVDRKLGAISGTCLVVIMYLFSVRQWPIDITIPFEPSRPLDPRNFALLRKAAEAA